MLDIDIPTTDGSALHRKRHTKPEKNHHLLLGQLGFTLPPEIRAGRPVVETY